MLDMHTSFAPFPAIPRYGSFTLGKRIGILGGSFNPAHAGHVHISKEALKQLHLDEIWWLVSPQNPLKKQPAALAERLEKAQMLLQQQHLQKRIKVVAYEPFLGSRYTQIILDRLKKRNPKSTFVWIMGADNMLQLQQWRNWSLILQQNFVAVFNRKGYYKRIGSAKAAIRFRHNRKHKKEAFILAYNDSPCWVMLSCRLHPASSTQLREVNKTSATPKIGNAS